MPRIIFISPHFKSGHSSAAHLSYLVRYIATREGVAPVADADRFKPATEKQEQMIRQLVRDFPSAKKRFEYEDYLARPTRENDSDFIQTALEQNLDQIGKRENYVDYIGTRPGVSKLDTHGLFDGTGKKLVISQVQKEIAAHPGVVWTPVISLRREDAHAMGFESPESWRAMLCSCAAALAKGYKIKPENLRWYAAFHDKSHHPHIHMIIYSTDPTEGFLTKQGIAQVKSALAQSIFPEQLKELYAADTQRRDALKADARKLYQELIAQMAGGTVRNERVEKLTAQLVTKLAAQKGKLQYGYLQAPVKALVDEIVDELARDARVAEAYRLWFDIRTDIVSTYQDEMLELPPLSQQKEFKPIRNMVVTEAAKLLNHAFTFEETPTEEQRVPEDVRKLVKIIHAPDATRDTVRDAAAMLLRLADEGDPDAAYAFGKLLLQGGIVQKDVSAAVHYFTEAANGGNSCAMYALGKLYLAGEDIPQDKAAALDWFTRSAQQGNTHAQFYTEHWAGAVQNPSVFLSATRLLHHMSRVFQNNTPPQPGGVGYSIDKKLRRRMKEKKIAQGHKADDQEQQQDYIIPY